MTVQRTFLAAILLVGLSAAPDAAHARKPIEPPGSHEEPLRERPASLDRDASAWDQSWTVPAIVGAIVLAGGLAITITTLVFLNSQVLLAYAVAGGALMLLSMTATAATLALTNGLWSAAQGALVAPLLGALLQPFGSAMSIGIGYTLGFALGVALLFTPLGNSPWAAIGLPIGGSFFGAFMGALVVGPALAHAAVAAGVTWFFQNAEQFETE